MSRYALAFSFVTLAAAAGAQSARPAPAAAPEDGAKVICRSQTVTGSIMPRQRVCHSKDEWRTIEAAGRDEAARMRDRPQFTPRAQ